MVPTPVMATQEKIIGFHEGEGVTRKLVKDLAWRRKMTVSELLRKLVKLEQARAKRRDGQRTLPRVSGGIARAGTGRLLRAPTA